MFEIRKMSDSLSNLNSTLAKFNTSIHGSVDAARKTTEHVRSGASGIMAAKGVKDCVVSYPYNGYVCLTISTLGTVADVSNHICGNIPGLKAFTLINTYVSIGCKYFVHLCRTGKITFSCSDLVE